MIKDPARYQLSITEFRTLSQIRGPLLFVDGVKGAAYDELVEVIDPDGATRIGKILEVDGERCVVQVFSGTSGLDLKTTRVRLVGDVARIGVSLEMLGRIFDGSGRVIDGGPPLIPEASLDVNGLPMNPTMRARPSEFIQTGISAIDGVNTLARGQKLPVFSGAGLPANDLAAQIVRQATLIGQVQGGGEQFAVVFAGIGITHREAAFFMDQFRTSGSMENTVLFINYADDPAVERMLTPRAALTAAEYLAYTHHMHVLVILTDMTNYCEALRQIGAAREEVPGRRGYPGYMYTDLASIYERAGIIKGVKGSVTQIPILTMPGDDITHPIPDLTGYITEGQIVVNRDLHRKGIYPPINVLPSLSRLMNLGIGKGHTREDHKKVSDQLYAAYAEGNDLRGLVAIVGKDALSERDRMFLEFADLFEDRFVRQGLYEDRSIVETLDLGWDLLATLPEEQLVRIDRELIQKYHPKYRKKAQG